MFKKVICALMFLLLCPVLWAQSNGLILIRHGQSDHNLGEFHSTNPKHPKYKISKLTPLGIKQINETYKKLSNEGFNSDNIEKVFVSPLPRTMQTAEILIDKGFIKRENLIIEPRLIETNAGELEGLSSIEYPDELWMNTPDNQWKTEVTPQVRTRVKELLEEIQRTPINSNILLISHSTPSQLIIETLTNQAQKLKTGEFFYFTFKSE